MRKPKSLRRRFALWSLVALLTTGLALSVAFAFLWRGEKLNTAALSNMSNPLVILDNSGNPISGSKTVKYCPIDEISQNAVNAFIAVEDKTFYRHHGLSYRRIGRAVAGNIRAGYSREGASTISQQLIKNTHLTHEKTLKRKIREAVLTKKLEGEYKKDEIMEMYLNAIYFGNNIYGIANASEFYYGKKPADLTAAESAGLAGMIQNPKRFDPISNYDKFMARANLVLNLMRSQGYPTEGETKINIVESRRGNASSYQIAVIAEAAKLLNISETDVVKYGYKIETYFDPAAQGLLYKYMNEREYEITNTDGAAADKFACLTDKNGNVTALWASTPTLLTARRNFGSVVKPLLVYAPAIELGAVSPESMVDDSPLLGEFNPKNMDGKYRGLVSVRESAEQSYNIPAVKIFDAVGAGNACAVARRMGLNVRDENLSAALGNTAAGVTFYELLAGYQTLSNGGKVTAPKFVKSVRDRNGKIIYHDSATKYSYRPAAVGADTAYLMTDILCGVSKHGTGQKLKSLPFQIASKTGTNERENGSTNTDATFVAYTTENVLVAWAGNADMKPQNDLPRGAVGGGMLGFIARDIFRELSANAAPADFVRPASVTEQKIDADDQRNGDIRLANPLTPAMKSKTALFSSRFAPTAVSANYLTVTPPTVDGQITNSAAELWFDARPNQTYEIYKGGVLQEVIENKTGEYHYTDKHADGIGAYSVVAKIDDKKAESNEIKLYAPATKRHVGRSAKPWYF